MTPPPRKGPRSRAFDRHAVVRVLQDIIDVGGGVSEGEARLLAVIAKRLERLEREQGQGAALAAARRIRQIWLQAVEGENGRNPARGLN